MATRMPLTITRFASVVDPVGELVTVEWRDWIRAVRATPRRRWPGGAPQGAEKRQLPGWSAASFIGGRRALANVCNVSCLALDFDDGACDDLRALGVLAGVQAWTYTSPSHTPEHPRFRLIAALTRPVVVDEYTALWSWARDRYRARGIVIDVAARDASRFWYAYAPTASGAHRVQVQEGRPISVDKLLARVASPAPCPVEFPAPRSDVSTEQRVRRATAYLAKMAPAVQGQRGQTALFLAAEHVALGFDLPDRAFDLLRDHFNNRCSPPWNLSNPRELHEFRGIIARTIKNGKMQRGKLL